MRDEKMPVVEKLLYSKKDAAFALSISVRSIENMLADKRLTFRKMGTRVLIPASEVRRVARLEQLG